MSTQEMKTVTMRLAGPNDVPAVERLAALDSQRTPAGDVMIAEVGGELRAAVPVEGGPAIADPFRHTSDVVALLEERVSQLDEHRRRRGFGSSLRLARAA